LEEACRTVLQDGVGRCRYRNLRLLDQVGVDAIDSICGIASDVSIAVVLAGGIDFLVAQIGEVGWRCALGCPVAVTVGRQVSGHVVRYIRLAMSSNRWNM